MSQSSLILGEALANRCSQVLYRCLEEVGSTKGALYLRAPGHGGTFEVVSFFGWPRGTRPPVAIPEAHPLLVRAHRERRTFVVNDASESPELAAFGQGGEWPRYLITPVYLAGDWVGLLIQRDRIKGGTFEVERDESPTLAICGDLVQALREFRLYGLSARPDEVALSPHVPDPTYAEPAKAPGLTAGPSPGSVSGPAVGPTPGMVPEGLPTASIIIDEVAPVAERLLPPAHSTTPPLRAQETHIPSTGPSAQERMYGFPGGQDGYTALPWEADRTLSGWVAPPPQNPERKRGMVPPEQRAFFWEIAGLLSQILAASAVALWIEDTEEIRPILAFSMLPLSSDLQQQILAHATFHLPLVREQDLRIITRVEMTESPEISGAFSTYMPLLLNETLQGHDLLLVFRQEDHSFSISEIEAIQKLGRILALHMQEARLHERYHHAFLSVSHRILQSSESRMPSLRPHSLATARLARDLALKLELSTEEVEAVSIAAILHDVGLLLLDPVMLNKPNLTSEELKKVRNHPELAAVFLKDLRFPFDVVKMIRHHHERWDGRGYPEGLRETGIPIGSRIIALIEAYEVMTSGKGYRSPKGHRQVLVELENEAGAQFDPKVVSAFHQLMTRKGTRGWSSIAGVSMSFTRSQRGFTMALALAVAVVMGLMLMKTAPALSAEVQRENESELIFRGEAIASALKLYMAKTGRYPTNLEEVMKLRPRILRQVYKDPMTRSGEWEFVTQVQAGASGNKEGLPIIGVRSRSPLNSIHIYQNRTLVRDWLFAGEQNLLGVTDDISRARALRKAGSAPSQPATPKE